jgi:mycofactocin precursor
MVVAGSTVSPEPGGSGVVFRAGARARQEADPGEPLVAMDTPVSWQARMRLSDGLRYHGQRPQREVAVMLAEDQDVQEAEASVDDDVDEILIEEISIDGMCGVY